MGNENLNPEEAISEEIGVTFSHSNIDISAALFNRNSTNIIDYVKNMETDLWQATNIQELNSYGLETNIKYRFNVLGHQQRMQLGYTYLKEALDASRFAFSRYSINSLKHHLTITNHSQFLKNVSHSVVYKFAERTNGETYSVVDLKITLNVKAFEFSIIGNNIFNEIYTETNQVPMPKGNVLLDVGYKF